MCAVAQPANVCKNHEANAVPKAELVSESMPWERRVICGPVMGELNRGHPDWFEVNLALHSHSLHIAVFEIAIHDGELSWLVWIKRSRN